MFATDQDPQETEALAEEPDELDEDEEEEDENPLDDDEDEATSASLDQLLAQRAAARRVAGDPDDDEDMMSLASERGDLVREPVATRVLPLKQRQEFVCNGCRLVKAKSQLADPQRGLCRDCV